MEQYFRIIETCRRVGKSHGTMVVHYEQGRGVGGAGGLSRVLDAIYGAHGASGVLKVSRTVICFI